MKCFFCQVEMLNQFTHCDLRGKSTGITHFTCQICKTKYAYVNEKEAIMYFRIYGTYNNRTYVAHFNLDEQYFYLGYLRSEVADIIFRLNFLPKGITPNNFSDKLPTYLTFA